MNVIMDLPDLRRAGAWATRLKDRMVRQIHPGSRLGQIRGWVEQAIRTQGYQVLFPLNLCPSQVLAHKTVAIQDQTPVTSPLTLDLGFRGPGVLIDTAVTIGWGPDLALIQGYRVLMAQAIRVLGQEYRARGFLRIGTVTRLVHQLFAGSGTLVEECCGHVMAYPSLYHKTIPYGIRYMSPDQGYQIQPGQVFTLEPHFLPGFGRYTLGETPGHIIQEGDRYGYGQGGIPEIRTSRPGFYQEHVLYLGPDRELVVIT